MPRHAVGDDGVVLDDQDLGHTRLMMEEARAYEELRVGFTAAVSHELRTPLARLLALLETAALPGADRDALLAQAREQVEEMSELVDDVLFLSELESGREVVALGSTRGAAGPARRSATGSPTAPSVPTSTIRVEADPDVELPLRRRMLQIVVENLAENAIRYAGPGVDADARRRAPACSRRPTTAAASRRTSSPGSSSASTAATGLAPRAAPASVSRSSSTSSTPPAARSRRPAARVAGCTIRCTFPPVRAVNEWIGSVLSDAFSTTFGSGEKSSFGP